RAAEAASAQGLTYLALVAVPLLAALALGWLAHGARPLRAILVLLLFALAWADRGGLVGEGAALLLSGLSCVALGTLLAAVTPARWLAGGIVAMALADTALVVSDLLQRPKNALNRGHAAPACSIRRTWGMTRWSNDPTASLYAVMAESSWRPTLANGSTNRPRRRCSSRAESAMSRADSAISSWRQP